MSEELTAVGDDVAAEIATAPEPEMHLMVDIETWAADADATIISIGAVAFDPNSEYIRDTFYVAITPESNVPFKRTIDPGTVQWWMGMDRTIPREQWLRQDKVDLFTALDGLALWSPAKTIWGYGAAFDNAILESAYRAVGIRPFWSRRTSLCYRTIQRLAPDLEFERQGEHHNALDDAITQAKHMQKIVSTLGLTI